MSLVIGVYVREGIVMASDSRLTLTLQRSTAGGSETLSVPSSDSNYKTFVTAGHIGISTFGAADISGVPLAGFIESFIRDEIGTGIRSPEEVAKALATHFGAMAPVPQTGFMVGGYQESSTGTDQQLWSVDLSKRSVTRSNPLSDQGVVWGGEADILARLLGQVGALDEKGQLGSAVPFFPIPYQFFTLQDAIDFAVYAIRSTIDSLRFQARAKTVGGPIDVLVLKPGESIWVARKSLAV